MKQITMTYIEVLEGMLQRKREAIKVVQCEVATLPDSFNKRKLIELNVEIAAFETCLDLAKVMFDGAENTQTHNQAGATENQ